MSNNLDTKLATFLKTMEKIEPQAESSDFFQR